MDMKLELVVIPFSDMDRAKMITLARRSWLRPRIGPSRAFSLQWSPSTRWLV